MKTVSPSSSKIIGTVVSPYKSAGEPSKVFSSSSTGCLLIVTVPIVGCVINSSLINPASIPSREEPVSTRNVAVFVPIRTVTVIPWSMHCFLGTWGS